MKLLSLSCMSLMFCLFAGANQAEARDTISGTSYNFAPTDYSRGEARVVKTSLPPPPVPQVYSSTDASMTILRVVGVVLLVFLVLIIIAAASSSNTVYYD
jgi:hypothetical protein